MNAVPPPSSTPPSTPLPTTLPTALPAPPLGAPADDAAPPSAASSGTSSAASASPPAQHVPPWVWRGLVPLAAVLAAVAAGAVVLALQSQRHMETIEAELLRRQQEAAQATQAAGEARLLARQAETAVREVVGKIALLEARLSESVMHRSQFEDLLQSLARSRDENVLADLEAAVRVAQQQSAITGSAEPLTQMLRQAEERLARYGQPRLERVRRAVVQDQERIRAAGSPDLAQLAGRLDELMRQIDDLPLLVTPPQTAPRRGAAGPGPGPGGVAGEAVPTTLGSPTPPGTPAASAAGSGGSGGTGGDSGPWAFAEPLRRAWHSFAGRVWAETRSLVRVTRIDEPQAMLIAPEQAYFLRENVKLRLLNARLAVLSRQFDVAQSDLREAHAALERYFDRGARRTALAMEALRQVTAQARTVVLPRPDATLAAIAAASAGR